VFTQCFFERVTRCEPRGLPHEYPVIRRRNQSCKTLRYEGLPFPDIVSSCIIPDT
jgi:hypothetical protein